MPVTAPVKLAVIILAAKSPFVSRLTIVLAVLLEVAVVILEFKVAIVAELTPPTLFTVGKSAVPPRSFANFNIPFKLVVASGTAALVMLAATNAVVAS